MPIRKGLAAAPAWTAAATAMAARRRGGRQADRPRLLCHAPSERAPRLLRDPVEKKAQSTVPRSAAHLAPKSGTRRRLHRHRSRPTPPPRRKLSGVAGDDGRTERAVVDPADRPADQPAEQVTDPHRRVGMDADGGAAETTRTNDIVVSRVSHCLSYHGLRHPVRISEPIPSPPLHHGLPSPAALGLSAPRSD